MAKSCAVHTSDFCTQIDHRQIFKVQVLKAYLTIFNIFIQRILDIILDSFQLIFDIRKRVE